MYIRIGATCFACKMQEGEIILNHISKLKMLTDHHISLKIFDEDQDLIMTKFIIILFLFLFHIYTSKHNHKIDVHSTNSLMK